MTGFFIREAFLRMSLFIGGFLILANTHAQTAKPNFDFETIGAGDALPSGWFAWGTYEVRKDSAAYHGDLAGYVTSGEDGSGSFGCVCIPCAG